VALGFNPVFSDWPVGATYPTGWALWTGAPLPIKETTLTRIGPFSVKFIMAGAANAGMVNQINFGAGLPVGTYVGGSIDIRFDTASAAKPGILVRLFTDVGASVFVDVAIQPISGTVNVWHRVPWTARVGAAQQIFAMSIYIMGAWSSFPGGSYNGTAIFASLTFAFFDSTTDNTAITVNANGSVAGGPTGQVTITGLGFLGNLRATIGNVLNNDPNVTVIAGEWSYGTIATGISNGITGATALRSTDNGIGNHIYALKSYPIDRNKAYRVSCLVRREASAVNGTFYLGFICSNAAGTVFYSAPASPYTLYSAAVSSLTTSFVRHSVVLPQASVALLDSTFVAIAPHIILGYTGAPNNMGGYVEAQDIRMEEIATTSTLDDQAATTVYVATLASYEIPSQSGITMLLMSVAHAGWYEITVTGRYEVTTFNALGRMELNFTDMGFGSVYGDTQGKYQVTQADSVIQVSQSITVQVPVPGTFRLVAYKTNNVGQVSDSHSGTLVNLMLRAVVIKR